MIESQIIKENSKPIAIILDYNEYLRLKEYEMDIKDYFSAVETKQTNKKWFTHDEMKKELNI